MASELTLSHGLSYSDSNGVSSELVDADVTASVTTPRVFHTVMSVTTSEVAINLGPITSLGYFIAKNLDGTNYIELRVGTGSTKFATIYAGQFCGPIFLGAGITAPYAIANGGACLMEYILCSA